MKRGNEHHLDETVDMAVHWGQGANIDAQATSEAGTHGFDVKVFTLDFTGFDHVFGQRCQTGLIAKRQSNIR